MTDRAAYVAGLRTLADRLEANPDCPLPYTGVNKFGPLDWILDSREAVSQVARLLGNVTKGRDAQGSLTLTSSLHGLGVRVLTFGDVCERVEVGTTTETREVEVCSVCEAPLVTGFAGSRFCTAWEEGSEHTFVEAPAKKSVEVEVPRYEVRCPPSILAPAKPNCITYADDSGSRCAHPTGHGGEHETAATIEQREEHAQSIEAEQREEHAQSIEAEQRTDWIAQQLEEAAVETYEGIRERTLAEDRGVTA